jgi:hypothetical protein
VWLNAAPFTTVHLEPLNNQLLNNQLLNNQLPGKQASV